MSERNVRARVGGTLQDAQDVQVRHEGQLKSAKSVYTRRNGELVQVWPRPLVSQLSNRWLVDEASGTTWGDDIGTAGVSFNGGTWQTDAGHNGVYYLLDGVGDEGSTSSDVFINDSFTYGHWFRVDDLSQERMITATPSDFSFLCRLNADGNNQLNITMEDADSSVSSGNASLNTSTAISTGVWHFVGIVADFPNTLTGYYAQASDDSLTQFDQTTYDGGDSGDGLVNAPYPMQVGHWDSDRHFEGGLDHPIFADGAVLSQSDLEDWFDATKDDYL